MSTPPTLPPPMPSSDRPKSSMPCVLLGCGAVALFGIAVICIAAFWFFRSNDHESGGSGSSQQTSSGDAGLSVGAKLSQYEYAGGSACMMTQDGAWHAVFQESSGFGQTNFIFHRFSRDNGATWSPAENISIDGTGSWAGYPKIAEDQEGNLYAAWIQFPGAPTLDGPGGYNDGNLTLRRFGSGHWEAPKILGTPGKVFSFCIFTGATGQPELLWADQGGMFEAAKASDGVARVVVAPGTIPGSTDSQFGRCLSAMTDIKGHLFFTAERHDNNSQQLFLWGRGNAVQPLLTDPKYDTRNTFDSPAQIFADPTGRIHVICQPNPKVTEHSELWDIDPATGGHQVIFAGRNGQETIQGFQILARDGMARVVTEWSAKPAIVAECTDFVAIEFDGHSWLAVHGLTGNARAAQFFYKDTSALTGVGMGTSYHAKHASLAIDGQGDAQMLGTIQAYTVLGINGLQSHGGSTYRVTNTTSTAQYSLYVIPWK